MAVWLSSLWHCSITSLDTFSPKIEFLCNNLGESSNKGVKNGGHDAIEKLVFLYFVMASQASYIYFSFHNALDTSSKKGVTWLAIRFLKKTGGNKG